MSNSILLSKLRISSNYENIDSDFDIYEFSTSDKYIKYGAKIIDDVFESIKALSIVFESGKSFYVLYNKLDASQRNIASALKLETFKLLSVKKIYAKQVPEYLLAQLLLNSLNNYKNESLAFNNITGKLFCLNFDWCKRKKAKEGNASEIKQIVCVEIKIDKNNVLNFPLTTFTSIGEKEKLIFKKKKIFDYLMYQLASSATLKRVACSFNKDNFIQKQYPNTKNSIKLIDFSDYESFTATKLGVLYKILKLAKQKLSLYLSLQFVEVSNFTTVKSDKLNSEYKCTLIKEALCECKINLINKAVGNGTDIFAEQVLNKLKECNDCKVELCKVVDDGFNVVIINNKEYYEKYENLEDLHDTSYGSAIVQHITFEDYNLNISAATSCIIDELIIKKDCQNKKLTFADWKRFSSNMLFCIRHQDRFAFLAIDEVGNLSYKIIENDLFSNDIYQSIINHYIEFENSVGKDVECVFKIGDSIIGIHKSGMVALPKFNIIGEVLEEVGKQEAISAEELKSALDSILCSKVSAKTKCEVTTLLNFIEYKHYSKSEIISVSKNRNITKLICNTVYEITGKRIKSYFRSNDIKYDLFASNLNINWFEEKGQIFYWVGEKNEGIQTEFARASVVREVCCLNGGFVDMKLISKLLTIDFVRNEQYTVVPFLVKYLRELIKIENK